MFKCYEMKRISEIVLGMEITGFFDVPFKPLIFYKISTRGYIYIHVYIKSKSKNI